MRTIYKKRSLIITLISSSSLISILYMVDYYFFQSPQVPVQHAQLGLLRKVVLQSKSGDSLIELSTNFSKCSVTLILILCEDEIISFESPGINESFSQRRKKHFGVPGIPVANDFSRQINQTLVLLKSVALQTHFDTKLPSSMRNCVKVIILGDKKVHFDKVQETVDREWSTEFQGRIKLAYLPVTYPKDSEWMRKMFRPCATLRLFIPDILEERRKSGENVDDADDVDSSIVVYVDTDFIFLRSVQSLVATFFAREKATGSKIVAGMAPCLFHYGTSANKIPYFGSSGLNAGLMVMNVSRMEESLWSRKVRLVTRMFGPSLKLADQDILNIYFHFFPEELQLLSCDWNFRPFQCRRGSRCEDSSGGISALHGNALSFTSSGPEPLFHTLFQVFQDDLHLQDNFSLESFVEHLETRLMEVEEVSEVVSDCVSYGEFRTLVLRRFDDILRSLETTGPDFEVITESEDVVYDRV